MNLNRGLIKQQAKQLIQNNVLKLFAVSIVIGICVSAASIICAGIVNVYNIVHGPSFFSIFNEDFDDYYDDYFDDYFDDDFNNFGYEYNFDDEYGKDFNNFGNEYYFEDDFGKDFNDFGNEYYFDESIPNNSSQSDVYNVLRGTFLTAGLMILLSLIANVLYLLLSPLEVSLSGYYVSFIRGKNIDFGDGIRTVFRNTFSKNYIKKIALVFLRGLFCGLLSCFFIIPGIIYYYSTYFAFQIMEDNPEISPIQALDLSKQMVKGNRTELFVLDLSFIPWNLLCIFIFPLIYVIPYMSTTVALFYENFRIRALQQGRITEDDFLSDSQRYAKYSNFYANQYGQGYEPANNQQNFNQANSNPYYNAPQTAYQNQPNQPNQQGQYGYQPTYQQPASPQGSTYTQQQPPEEPVQPKPAESKDPWEINHED